MAHRESIKNEQLEANLEGADFYWNISAAVGWGCKNRQSDVMLVQYLLTRAYGIYSSPPFKTPIVIDGIFGPQTYKWIRAFQSGNGWLGIDGKVDAVDGTRETSTISRKGYTIHWLNVDMQINYPHLYNDITIDKKLPAVLCNELMKIVVDDGVIAA